MDSVKKLESIVKKTMDSANFDDDIKVNFIIADIKYWCENYLVLLANIEETSLNKNHEVERKKKLINLLFDL